MKRAATNVSRFLLVAVFILAAPAAFSARTQRTVTADRVVVSKSDRTLTLYRGGQVLKKYKVTFGREPVGAKQREGDDRTPEGQYVLDSRNFNSRYHIALHVSYPNAEDRRRATAAGYSPGGAIMIHGLRSGFGWLGPLHRTINWTHGCIAVTNSEIEEIARAVPNGTPIRIEP